MKRRMAALLLGVVAAVGLSVAPSHASAVLVVDNRTGHGDCAAPGPVYRTIQRAVADAVPGDTVRVCPGLYRETVTVRTPELTIQGARHGVDARRRSQHGESIVTGADPSIDASAAGGAVQLLADGITWDGFTIAGNTLGPGMHTSPGSSGDDIRNTIFDENGLGLYLNTSGARPTWVHANRFTANNEATVASAGNGIYSDQGAMCVLIDDNLFEGHNGAGVLFADSGKTQQCVGVERNTSVEDRSFATFYASSHVRVLANTITSHRHDAEPGSAIFIGARNHHVLVQGNHVDGAGGNGIDVTDSGPPGHPVGTPDGIQVLHNQVREAQENGIHLGKTIAGAAVTGNTALASGGVDCLDESRDGGTAGTANTWLRDVGDTDDPDGICPPSQPPPPHPGPRHHKRHGHHKGGHHHDKWPCTHGHRPWPE